MTTTVGIDCPKNKFYIDGECEGQCHCRKLQYCRQSDGVCTQDGCMAGYKGKTCQTRCTDRKFGENCQKSCHCFNQTQCDSFTGECEESGCETGYTGPTCQTKDVQISTPILPTTAIIGIGLGIAVIIIIIIVFVLLRKKLQEPPEEVRKSTTSILKRTEEGKWDEPKKVASVRSVSFSKIHLKGPGERSDSLSQEREIKLHTSLVWSHGILSDEQKESAADGASKKNVKKKKRRTGRRPKHKGAVPLEPLYDPEAQEDPETGVTPGT